MSRKIKTTIGNKVLELPDNHNLPVYLSKFPLYDRALPRIARSLKRIDGFLKFIDVGANIGDTVSLVTDSVQGDFLCIEGDKTYLPILHKNTEAIPESKIFIEETYCGEKDCIINAKVSRSKGTAKLESDSAGKLTAKVQKLDTILEQNPDFKKANLLKIDTDGFEVAILKGGRNFIKSSQPVIFFEFDPKLYRENVKNPSIVFKQLLEAGYREALFYDNFGIPKAVVDISDSRQINLLTKQIDDKNIYYYDVLAYPEKGERYREIIHEELLDILGFYEREQERLKLEVKENKQELSCALEACQVKAREVSNIYNSKSWKLINLLRRFFPNNSIRFKLARAVLTVTVKLGRGLRKIANYRHSVSWVVDRVFSSRKKRSINKTSKKIAYIGHSYHVKTQSTAFLLDYLREFYEVEVIEDESWKGEGDPYPDLTHIDQSYLGVIFFQNLPDDLAVLDKIDNDNLIFFPMYDATSTWTYADWRKLRGFKIMNFSSTLHKKLKKWGYQTSCVQYFPKPAEFIPGDEKGVFFWQRLSFLNINTVSQLLGDYRAKVHIHKAIDPCHEFMQPDPAQEKKYAITYSDWFETRGEMWDLIKKKGIYIAPREYEGIGMSFLEAMAMGKAVVAVNNPTMNEYIVNGKTGYLFSLNNPLPIDFANIASVQKNTYEYMKDGYQSWERDKRKIIDFIESE